MSSGDRKAVIVLTWIVAVLAVLGLLIWGILPFVGNTDKKNDQRAGVLIEEWKDPSPSNTPQGRGIQEPKYDLHPGKDFAVISIPKLKVRIPVAEGTTNDVLARAVGHYQGTAGPGQTGNFATAGHVCCRSHGQPYKHLDDLRQGDQIVVTTKSGVYTYSVVAMPSCTAKIPALVKPQRVDVIWASPCVSDKLDRQLMTLTTCYPDRSEVDLTNRPAPYRLIIWAELVKRSS